jgi:hypothetical protein
VTDGRRRCAALRKILLPLAILFLAAPASAQSRFELGAGLTWTGGFDAGGQDALLTRDPASGSAPLVLFDTSSRVNAAPGAGISLGFYVTPHFAVEAVAEYSRPVLRTTISSDFEGATGTTADSRLTSLVVGGSARFHFGAARLAPFVFAGAGWTRQLNDDNVMLVTGLELHGGGGLTYRLDRHFGLRAQAGVSAREKSIAFVDKRRALPAASGSLLYRF